jgi:hypothetical protein
MKKLNGLDWITIVFIWLTFILLCGITIVHFPAFFGLVTFWCGWWYRGIREKYG